MSTFPVSKKFLYQWIHLLGCASFALILFGSKLWLINDFGNATPFWDQWDGEAKILYKPLLDGTYTFGDLFSAHNEHRIMTVRLLDMVLLYINGIWNPFIEMLLNAVILTTACCVAIMLIVKSIGKEFSPAIIIFTAVLFIIPNAWENTLMPFQGFYFLILFSVISIWLLLFNRSFSLKWWLGILCGWLGYFSLASGVFILQLLQSFLFYSIY